MSDKKIPCECNHCKSKNISHQIWGRTEFWSCLDCKKEVNYVEPRNESFALSPGLNLWDPKYYGFGVNTSDTDITQSSKYTFKGPTDGTVILPDNVAIDWGLVNRDDLKKFYPDDID